MNNERVICMTYITCGNNVSQEARAMPAVSRLAAHRGHGGGDEPHGAAAQSLPQPGLHAGSHAVQSTEVARENPLNPYP